jgi:hypothetical protein
VKRGPAQGFTLMEALVALLLMGFVIQGGWAVFSNFRTGAERVSLGAQKLETVRTLGWVLSEELSGGRRGQDWWLVSDDSISLRAYRGLAWVQEWETGGRVRVCYRGIRNPNPKKDSLLSLDAEGVWLPRALLDRSRGGPGCAGEGKGWTESGEVEEGGGDWILARVFEVGSYHFSQGAFRYRSPGGGRRPLTAENLIRGSLRASGGSSVGLDWAVEVGILGSTSDSLPWLGRIR